METEFPIEEDTFPKRFAKSLSDLENEGPLASRICEKNTFEGEYPSIEAFICLSPTDS
jgi:hypothetical protein